MKFENRKLEWLEYDLLGDHPIVNARTYLRHGGVSTDHFFSLNVSNTVGDHLGNVKVNRQIVQESMGVSKLVFANQTHSNAVVEITKSNLDHIPTCDALVTKEKDIALVITHADCQAALFYDPEYQIIAAVHAGWKGLVKNIYQKTLNFLQDRFNSRLENVIACISPSLCLDHAVLKNYKKELPKDFWVYQEDHFHFDFRKIGLDQLKKEGIQESNIEVAKDCTFCDQDNYYSFRRDKDTGRHATVICFKK